MQTSNWASDGVSGLASEISLLITTFDWAGSPCEALTLSDSLQRGLEAVSVRLLPYFGLLLSDAGDDNLGFLAVSLPLLNFVIHELPRIGGEILAEAPLVEFGNVFVLPVAMRAQQGQIS